MPDKSPTFCFLLFDGFSNMVLASALEPLRVAHGLPTGPDFTWETASVFDQPVQSSSGLQITPSLALAEVENVDYLILVSGYGVRQHATPEVFLKLHQLRNSARHIVGIDTGAWLMAEAGFLEGHEATIHWQEMNAFGERFPNVTLSEDRFVQSGNHITCGGASTVMDMILKLIQDQYGAALAFDVSNMFVFDVNWKFGINQGAGLMKTAGSPALRAAVNTMADNIEHPISLSDIADATSTSLRSLNRIFLNELQMPPGKYYQLLRLTRARDMAVETHLSVIQISLLTGFSSASALSRAFSMHYKMRISSVRKRKQVL
ncbi:MULTISPECIES: GlxA family transcriptional regulator [Falsihalocynthiibacter]|uniref:GlxA family transcriptional regulator n=1 Tax=Falsihalocynthiibacter TaxID=2854182 RepID=UPI00300115DE